MYQFFYSPNSCSLATHIVLEEIGAPFEPVRVDLAGGEQRQPAYLALNPAGRVPALATPQGVLNETPALLAFLAQAWPQARLAPLDDAFGFAKLQSFNSYLCSTVHVARAHGRRGVRWADDEQAIEAMKRKVPQNLSDSFALIESPLFAGPWVLGADYSVGDAYLFVLSRWFDGDGLDLSRFPKLHDHHARMLQRPAVQRALAREAATA